MQESLDYHKLLTDPALLTVFRGVSVVDYPSLNLSSAAQVTRLLSGYGYELPQDADEIESIRQQALDMLAFFVIGGKQSLPLRLVNNRDIVKLFLWASLKRRSALSLWSCALLRLMHTIAHCQSYFNQHYRRTIRQQIIGRYDQYMTRDKAGVTFCGIPLFDLQVRPLKSQRSVVIKLLHKKENVATDIFDWIGIRFITHNRLDVLKVLYQLRDTGLVMFANIKPSRSRNSLLDYDWMCRAVDALSRDAFERALEISGYPPLVENQNPHSHAHYHSIQFTARQRIRIEDPTLGNTSFFFPYEIQLMDKASFKKNRMGEASHEKYKERQFHSAARRALGALYAKHVRRDFSPAELS